MNMRFSLKQNKILVKLSSVAIVTFWLKARLYQSKKNKLYSERYHGCLGNVACRIFDLYGYSMRACR